MNTILDTNMMTVQQILPPARETSIMVDFERRPLYSDIRVTCLRSALVATSNSTALPHKVAFDEVYQKSAAPA